MRIVLALMSGLLSRLATGLILFGGLVGCESLLAVHSKLPAARSPLDWYRPGLPLNADEARAWAELISRLRSPTGGGPAAP